MVNDRVVEQFERDIRFSEEGYVIKLPWKTDGTKEELPDNRGIAVKRLHAIMKKYKDNDWVMSKYQETIEDQLQKGVIEEVDPNNPPTGEVVHYLSHHPVITPAKQTTKLRVVYDGSAHHVGKPSLNNALHQGPTILPNLVGQLLRFRFGKNAIIADVEKAFLQVVIDQSDRDATRFLWLKDVRKPPSDNNIRILRFRRVLFGVNASPFILGQTIVHHLDHFVPDVDLRNEIKQNLYVDNLVVTAETLEEGLKKYFQTKGIFNDIRMNLRDYSSNNQELLTLIPEKDRATSMQQRVLGIPWNTLDDTLEIACSFAAEVITTKRTMLKQHARNFDPLGFLTPLLIRTKVFIQKLWKKNYEWDTPMRTEDQQSWLKLLESIADFRKRIPRNCRGVWNKATIVVFSDASKVAQAACVYLLTDQGCHLMFARSKVNDTEKNQTIPKLELNAATIGARMSLTVGDELRSKCEIERVILFTDSEIALQWIKAPEPPEGAGTMVVNRWNEIRRIEAEWTSRKAPPEVGYIHTDLNPADCASRGISRAELDEHIWWNGPSFLTRDESEWPEKSRVQRLPPEKSVRVAVSRLKWIVHWQELPTDHSSSRSGSTPSA
ncbi:hypothetical protein L596_021165 [Steinernema carpocapsae]|uniref:Reverse transcriptase domain-containing protein n=1 Tax=Steinernema carpocapsae TaxID=34508 RepID=A0A4U5MVR8_STECR|nr:hypothetical protein L596_021165 [Steinernema carpocapsae]